MGDRVNSITPSRGVKIPFEGGIFNQRCVRLIIVPLKIAVIQPKALNTIVGGHNIDI